MLKNISKLSGALVGAFAILGTSALGIQVSGCTADIHDNTADIHDNTVNIDNAKVEVSTTADVEHVKPNDTVPVTVKATNVVPVEPTATPPAASVKAAGHFRFYIDSVDTQPVVVTAQVNVNITIGTAVKEGRHKIICRVHKHDGTPTTATFEINFTVTVTIGGGIDAGTPVIDAGTPIDAAALLDSARE